MTAGQQPGISVFDENIIAARYAADLFAADQFLVEPIATKKLEEAHSIQCMKTLGGIDLTLCLLLDFRRPCLRIYRIINNYGLNLRLAKLLAFVCVKKTEAEMVARQTPYHRGRLL
jgi:PD-(D/E)XK nuclease superfamily